MTFSSAIALFAALIVLAALPSLSVLTVTTRAATAGLTHGIFTTLGIVIGDIVFILIALLGLSLLTTTESIVAIAMQILGGLYLIFLAVNLCHSNRSSAVETEPQNYSHWASLMTGLLITLGDQKAIFFYLGFFPAFLNLSQITIPDVAIVIIIAIFAVGGVKLLYAFLADRARFLFTRSRQRRLNGLAAGMMLAVGFWLIWKSILQFL